MPVQRRDFMKVFGISLGSLLLARCQVPWDSSPQQTCYAPSPITPTTTPIRSGSLSPRERLHLGWLRFGELARKAAEPIGTPGSGGTSESFAAQIRADHRAALDELVAVGEISATMADLLQEAYAAAVFHIWRSNAPLTCYLVGPIGFTPASADDLVAQAAALNQVAEGTPIPAETLAKIRSALEHDLAYYALSDAEVEALYAQLREEYADPNGGIPDFADVQLNLSPDVIAAAEFLVAVLAEEQGAAHARPAS
jgi:hypothetical protein